MRKIAVPPGLRQHALARINQDNSKIGRGSAGHHVAGILLMPRGVRHNELALFGGEKPVGNIDGDALLALGCQPIHQQGKINVLPLRSNPF